MIALQYEQESNSIVFRSPDDVALRAINRK